MSINILLATSKNLVFWNVLNEFYDYDYLDNFIPWKLNGDLFSISKSDFLMVENFEKEKIRLSDDNYQSGLDNIDDLIKQSEAGYGEALLTCSTDGFIFEKLLAGKHVSNIYLMAYHFDLPDNGVTFALTKEHLKDFGKSKILHVDNFGQVPFYTIKYSFTGVKTNE